MSAVMDTSAQSIERVGLKKLAKQQQEIFDVVLGAQRNGADDMSLAEIREAYERRYSKRIETGRISARVADMVSAQRLAKRSDTRACSITGRNIHPVYVPEHQARLFG